MTSTRGNAVISSWVCAGMKGSGWQDLVERSVAERMLCPSDGIGPGLRVRGGRACAIATEDTATGSPRQSVVSNLRPSLQSLFNSQHCAKIYQFEESVHPNAELTALQKKKLGQAWEPSQPLSRASVDRRDGGWLSGVIVALPIVLGFVPVGIAFGILARHAGISVANTLFLSLLVYAGSSQFVAVGLFASGAHPLSIIVTTLVVNLRHLILSAAIAPFLEGWRKAECAALAHHLTDETFAVHTASFSTGVPSKAAIFATNVTVQAAWVAGTSLGIVAGRVISDVRPLALDFALPALFAALLTLQIKDRIQFAVALFTGLLAVGLLEWGLDQSYIVIATLAGATVGLGIEHWIKRSSSLSRVDS